MSIIKYATKDIVCISEDASLFEAAQLMKQKNVGSLIVVKNVDKDLTLTGMLTDRDIVTKLIAEDIPSKQITVKDSLTQIAVSVSNQESMENCIELMSTKGIRRLPIIDEHQRVKAIISFDDLFMFIAKKLGKLAEVIQKQLELS